MKKRELITKYKYIFTFSYYMQTIFISMNNGISIDYKKKPIFLHCSVKAFSGIVKYPKWMIRILYRNDLIDQDGSELQICRGGDRLDQIIGNKLDPF